MTKVRFKTRLERKRIATIKAWSLVGVVALAVVLYFATPLHTLTNITQFMSWTHANVLLGSVAFVLLYAAATAFFLPMTPFSVAGGYIFGTFMGAGLTIIGATLGATCAFLLSRWLGRDAVELWLEKHAKAVRIDDAAAKRGFWVILFLRLLPVIPYNGINVAAGLSRIKPSDYIAATALGLLPDIVLLSYVGQASRAPLSREFIIAIVVALAIAGVALLCHRYAEKHGWLKQFKH